MKLIKPYYEILPDTNNIFKNIEIAGRTCYKSEDKITEDSSEKFVQMLINRGHTAMLEHGTVYLKITEHWAEPNGNVYFYRQNKYSIVNSDLTNETIIKIIDSTKIYPTIVDYYITTNYRVLVENNRLGDLKYQCEPTEFHEKRISVKFVCDRGVSHELVRHNIFCVA